MPAHRNVLSTASRPRSTRNPPNAAPLKLLEVFADGIVTPPPPPIDGWVGLFGQAHVGAEDGGPAVHRVDDRLPVADVGGLRAQPRVSARRRSRRS